MENGTITVISSRPMGPTDYMQIGYQQAMQEVEALYRQACQKMGGGKDSGAKGKGNVTPSKDAKDPKAKAAELKSMGRGRDTELAHIRPDEAKLLKDNGGRGSRNPKTGLLEFDGDGGGDSGGGDSGGGDAGAAAGGADSGGAAGQGAQGGGQDGGGADSGASAGGGTADSSDQGGPSGAMSGYSGPSSDTGPADSGPGVAGLGFGPGETDMGAPATSGPAALGSLGDPVDVADAPGLGKGSVAGPTSTGISGFAGQPGLGQDVADALGSVMGFAGPLGTAFSNNANPLGMVGSIAGPIGGVVGGIGSIAGLANSISNFGEPSGISNNTTGSLAASPDSTSPTGSIPGGGQSGPSSGPSSGSTADGGGGDDSESVGGEGGVSSAGPTGAGGSSANLDSALQAVLGRPGSKTIAGVPYAPSFGGANDINPAALSAALGQIGRPRVGPGLNFGRTIYQ